MFGETICVESRFDGTEQPDRSAELAPSRPRERKPLAVNVPGAGEVDVDVAVLVLGRGSP
jgi:hypothetical protein